MNTTLTSAHIKTVTLTIGIFVSGSEIVSAQSIRFEATAYSVTGITTSGEWTHRHVVAADPAVLPLGSRVKIKHAGPYSGEYVVADTGAKIEGHKLDIYMPNESECKKFGVKPVRVRVISLGDGTRQAAKQADQAVKADIAKDLAKGTVGSAAIEVDWNKQRKQQ